MKLISILKGEGGSVILNITTLPPHLVMMRSIKNNFCSSSLLHFSMCVHSQKGKPAEMMFLVGWIIMMNVINIDQKKTKKKKNKPVLAIITSPYGTK